VIANSEAVALVANELQQMQHWRAAVEHHRFVFVASAIRNRGKIVNVATKRISKIDGRSLATEQVSSRRKGWRAEIDAVLTAASEQLGDVSAEDALAAVKAYRAERGASLRNRGIGSTSRKTA
jgi:hypothetical protein